MEMEAPEEAVVPDEEPSEIPAEGQTEGLSSEEVPPAEAPEAAVAGEPNMEEERLLAAEEEGDRSGVQREGEVEAENS
jgi:hypothetical protein